MDQKSLEGILLKALTELYTRDLILIEINVNERSISHKLASYLQIEIDFLGQKWDVDCEYNRMVSDMDDGFITKRLDLTVDNISSDDTKAKTVFPDIIIHHRGKKGSEDNLLVLEMKKDSDRDDHDLKKLRAYGEQLDYNFALYLNITKEEARGHWIRVDGSLTAENYQPFIFKPKSRLA